MHERILDNICTMKFPIQCSRVLILGLTFLAAVSSQPNGYNLQREYDVCDPKTVITNPNSTYLEYPGNYTEVFYNQSFSAWNLSPMNCHLVLKTCPQCYFIVDVVTLFNNNRNCGWNWLPDYSDDDDPCSSKCAHFFLFDPDYKNQTSKMVYSNGDLYPSYNSQSKQLHIIACGGMNNNQNTTMRLRFTSMEKIFKVKEYFESPYFPSPYAKNGEKYTYQLEASAQNRIMTVSFEDWSLSWSSYFEFDLGSDIRRVYGADNRPFITSTRSSMTVTFYTGDSASNSYLGFRALTTFYNNYTTIDTPQNDCDRVITSQGGFIRWNATDSYYYDCIWIIKKLSDFDGVYLRVLQYKTGYNYYETSDNRLVIYAGITSAGVQRLDTKPNNPSINSTVYRSDSGFYIRIRSKYMFRDSIILAYAMYEIDCDIYRGYFKCDNSLCISNYLRCDGYDHCGDNSDELSSICDYETTHSNSSYTISIGVIIPLVVSVFLIIVMCLLIIFIRRCRRLHNAANRGRPPGARLPQSRGRRHRRHRDVQMSVTLSSGEHPPSYDEVLQNTPIGYLNMAFTWSQHGNVLTQPPSYEEAVSPSSAQPNGNIAVPASSNSHGDTITNSQLQHAPTVLAATISASLDPRADVSSSSSSEGAIDLYRQLDISSSSDTSTENEHPMIANNCNLHNAINSSKFTKDAESGIVSQGFPKYGSDNGGVEVDLRTPSSEKLNTEMHEGAKFCNSLSKEEPNSNTNCNTVSGRSEDTATEVKDKHTGSVDNRNLSNSRGSQNPHSLDRRQEERRKENDRPGFSRNDDVEFSERERRHGRDKYYYQKNKGKHSDQNGEREDNRRDHRDDLNVWQPKVTDSSRSQSCVDLSWGGGATSLPRSGMSGLRDEDKRFSYAGTGDVSLPRGSLDPFYNGRGLIREKHMEHLDKYASHSSTDLRDGHRTRGHDNQRSDILSEPNVSSRHIGSLDQTGYYSRNKRDKSDLQRSESKHSALAPVQEHQFDEAYETAKLPDETPDKHKQNKTRNRDDKFQNNHPKDANKFSEMPSSRSHSQYGPGSSQTLSNIPQRFSNQDTRESERLRASHNTNAERGPQSYNTEDHQQYSHSQKSRNNAESPYSRQNYETQSENRNSNSRSNTSAAPSEFKDDVRQSQNPPVMLRNSDGSAVVPGHPYPDQHKETAAARPKPPLRPQNLQDFQTAQKPGRDVPETIARSSGQPNSQTSQKPTPAPRQNVKKRQDADSAGVAYASSGNQNQFSSVSYGESTQPGPHSTARYPDQTLPHASSAQQTNRSERPPQDSQQMWRSQETNRTPDGQRGREEQSSSAHPAEQSPTRGDQIYIQATNDHVFV